MYVNFESKILDVSGGVGLTLSANESIVDYGVGCKGGEKLKRGPQHPHTPARNVDCNFLDVHPYQINLERSLKLPFLVNVYNSRV